jgi:[ribosomal protein S18]-alanine N-acetyltransferase
MEKKHFITIAQMRELHLSEVLGIAQKNNLSYWSYEDYKAETLKEDSCCLVAEDLNKNVTGFLVARLIMTENCAELYNIAVSEDHKRKGIGKTLLAFLINQSVTNNLEQINLEVRESNQAAVNFYHKLDFQKAGVRKNFYTQPPENAITMIKFLNK